MTHHPVLLNEVIAGLALRPGAIVVDATVNRGGHARALCEAVGGAGQLIALDADADALRAAKQNLESAPGRKIFIEGNFRQLARWLDEFKIVWVDACLFDLGASSEQLFEPARGFSFRFSGPLTMTFQSDSEVGNLTAETIVNDWNEAELTRRLTKLQDQFGTRELFISQLEQAGTTVAKVKEDLAEENEKYKRNKKIIRSTEIFFSSKKNSKTQDVS